MQSPDSSMGSSSNDLVLTAAPAIVGAGGGASGAATGAMSLQTGFISASEEYKALKEWATNFHEQAQREQSLAKAQMQHLIGVVGESKKENQEFQKENTLLNNEVQQAKTMIQSEAASAHSKLKNMWDGNAILSETVHDSIRVPSSAKYQQSPS